METLIADPITNIKAPKTSRVAIQAASGGDKSCMTRHVLETTYRDMRHIVFDTEDKYSPYENILTTF